MTKSLVIEELRNNFLKDALTKSAFAGRGEYPFVPADHYFRHIGNDDGTFTVGGGPCYGQLDVRDYSWDNWGKAVVYLPPNRVDTYAQTRNFPSKGVIEARKLYSLYNFFHPDSPWSEVISTCFPEMFEGYDTPEDRAELVAKFGWFVGPTAFKNLTKTQLGAFMVYTRRQNEFLYVRETFAHLLEHKDTKDMPLAWLMFFAHHHMMNPSSKVLYQSHTSYSHNCFYPDMFPLTALAFTTQKVIPVGEGHKSTWRAVGGRGSWQSHNCDMMWTEMLKADPRYEKVQYKKSRLEADGRMTYFAIDYEKISGKKIHDICVEMFEEKVNQYVVK